MNVIKRDESVQEYNFIKIANGVTKAFQSVNQEVPENFLEQLKESVEKVIIKNNGNGTNIKEIQDIIQKELVKRKKYDVNESFINYRIKREELRLENSDLIKQIEEKLSGKNVQNQNANLDEASFGGRVGEMASVVCKSRALKKMRKQSRLNHEKNEVYIHDLDSWEDGRHNCLTIPIDDLLAKGFRTRQTDVRPAGSINTAMQLVAVAFQLQSLQQFGGVSCSHIDWSMVPYVRKSYRKNFIAEWIKEQKEFNDLDILNVDYEDFNKWILNMTTKFFVETKLEEEDFKFANENLDSTIRQKALYDTKRETYQAVEGMYHNLNTLQSRSGNQLPFTSINYGTCTELEGRMVIKALLEVSIRGLGKNGITSIFPCGIFQYMKGVNDKPGTLNYDLKRLALKSTSMRIYPNYANVDWSGNVGYDKDDPRTYFSTMGCHAKGTKIVMFDGTLKNVEDIVVGDKVMGIDSTPRTVKELIRGRSERMFEVYQTNGMTYTVNAEHLLALKYIYCNGIAEVYMMVKDFAELPKNERSKFLGFKKSLKEREEYGFTFSKLDFNEIGEGDFYGFELDGDRLYMLEDGTVTHNCRTANGYDINAEEGQNPYLKDGRGNICPVTIIMPTLAVLAVQKVNKKYENKDICLNSLQEEYFDEFMKILDKKINEAKDTLIERFNHITSQSAASAKFMYENKTMFGYHEEEGIISALKHGTLAIGQLGLAETLLILLGYDHTCDYGMEHAKKIEQLFKDRCSEFKQECKLNFGVYYTPAENLCYTAMKNFKKRFKDFEMENVTYFIDEKGEKRDKIYFTNSMHVPVWYPCDAFEKIRIESELTGYSSAGCITYVELPSKCHNNIDAVEKVVDYMMEHDIPYGAINIPLNTCKCCSEPIYDETLGKCPKCGCEEVVRLGRITGYLSTTVEHFNNGKQAEFYDRIKHFKN